jgi:response regulator NasT
MRREPLTVASWRSNTRGVPSAVPGIRTQALATHQVGGGRTVKTEDSHMASTRQRSPRALKVAILDADSSSRQHMLGAAAEAALDVQVAGPPRPDVLPLVRRTGCHAVVMGSDVPECLTPAVAAEVECTIVVCSANTAPEMIDAADRVGAMAFLVKPIRTEHLALTLPLAVTRFDEARRLRCALADRRIIECATGRLMMLRSTTEDDAFRWLRRKAMNRCCHLVDVARDVLDCKVSQELDQPAV